MPSLRPRCAQCGDVLGVYEPLIWETSDQALRTSLLRSPELSEPGGLGSVFHHACYEMIAAGETGDNAGVHE
jgi:hypothetical protein